MPDKKKHDYSITSKRLERHDYNEFLKLKEKYYEIIGNHDLIQPKSKIELALSRNDFHQFYKKLDLIDEWLSEVKPPRRFDSKLFPQTKTVNYYYSYFRAKPIESDKSLDTHAKSQPARISLKV